MSIALQAIPSDIPVILDSKRGDIDTTAQAYATSSFEIFNASAVTLSPYMGWDSVQPFVTGAFVSTAIHEYCYILDRFGTAYAILVIMNNWTRNTKIKPYYFF